MKRLILLILFASFLSSVAVNAQKIDTMVSVGSYRLHFTIIEGTGTPILFESGNGDDHSVWNDILEPIHAATNATLITYDRAGLGSSELDTTTISFDREIKDLHVALKALGYNRELFIVSHSFGGFYSTRYATNYSDQVQGMVFIDVALPCFFTVEWSRNFISAISADDWKMIKQYKSGLYYVLKKLDAISAEMQEQTVPAGIPVTLIAAENPPAMVRPAEITHWKECLSAYGSLPNHTYVLAKNAGHKVWADNPKIVIDEIISLYSRANPK